MHENNRGHLYSIDLPPYDDAVPKLNWRGQLTVLQDGQKHAVGEHYSVGDLVPEYLKGRWTLVYGDSKEELLPLLRKLGRITIFFHDSLHTYNHMLFEYETSWSYITKGGILLSHDVLWNKAFWDFSRKVNVKPLIYYGLGVIKK